MEDKNTFKDWSVKLVAATQEIGSDKPINLDTIYDDNLILAGKAAGICYMSDTYLSEGIQNKDAALKRANNCLKSGHTSVFEHGHVTFMIRCSKMVAMILNSTNLYNTSEKSARYTKMEAATNIEKELYDKWNEIFLKLIRAYDVASGTQAEKLAMENARYMLSVDTLTTLEYTVPFGRALLLPYMFINTYFKFGEYNFAQKIKEQLDFIGKEIYKELKVPEELKEELEKYKVHDLNSISTGANFNHKNIKLDFFGKFVEGNNIFNIVDDAEEYYGDLYTSIYEASFAEVAQAQRHRTLKYSVIMVNDKIRGYKCYVPNIIRNTPYEEMWIKDFNSLIDSSIYPQCTLLKVKETGRFEEFVLKCKERLCTRAQYEIFDITRHQMQKFVDNAINLSSYNSYKLSRITLSEYNVCYRCGFKDYTCKEPCKFSKEINYRNV